MYITFYVWVICQKQMKIKVIAQALSVINKRYYGNKKLKLTKKEVWPLPRKPSWCIITFCIYNPHIIANLDHTIQDMDAVLTQIKKE